MFAEVFMLNKVIASSGSTLPFVLLLLLKPVSCCARRPHPPTQAAKFEKWKKGTMQSGHILQPAVK